MKPPLYRSFRSLPAGDQQECNGPSTSQLSNRSVSLDSVAKQAIVDGEQQSFSSRKDGSKAPRPPPLPLPPKFFSASSVSRISSSKLVSVPREIIEVWDRLFSEGVNVDVSICTEDGGVTAAHSSVLAANSPVFKRILDDQKSTKHHGRTIVIMGVPYEVVRVFIRFLYSSRYEKQEMEQYVLHLLVLSHVYRIPLLKRICSQELEHGLLTEDNVVDVLQLARLCDVPRLNVLCLKFVVSNFKTVVKSEGWKVMRDSDQALEQELVGHVIETDARRQERLRKSEEEKVYKQLHDAMEALVHICRDGCRTIGPQQDNVELRPAPACNFAACKGLESLVRHFAGCRTKVSGGCVHCKRMWQLLELHSRMCSETETCKVPLCKHFKDRIGQQSKKEEVRWNLLVSKVMAAKGASAGFSLATVSERLEQEE